MSSNDWALYPAALAAVIERLQGVVIEDQAAEKILRYHDGPSTLHFVDPPYLHSTRTSRHRYRFEMDVDAHRNLADVLRGLKGAVVLSGYASPLYDQELYPDWYRTERATFAFKAIPKTEVLWLNKAATATAGGRLF